MRKVNVGDISGLGDVLLESTTAYAARFIQAVIDSSSEDSVSPEEAELMAKLGVLVTTRRPDRLEIPESYDNLEDILISLFYKHLSPKAIEHITYTSWKDGIDFKCVDPGMRSLIKEVVRIYSSQTLMKETK